MNRDKKAKNSCMNANWNTLCVNMEGSTYSLKGNT